jgi:hypothetical protein
MWGSRRMGPCGTRGTSLSFSCERKLFSAIKIHRAEKGFDAEVRKIIALLEEADREKCSMAVVVSDVRIKNLKDLRRQLRRAEKRLSDQGIISFIIGFAVHEIEAWILADDRARDAGLVEGLPYQYSGKPEDDPDPKSSLSRLIGEAIARDGRERHELETRKVMIESLRPKEVSRLCPLGFAPFNKRESKAPLSEQMAASIVLPLKYDSIILNP